MNVRITVTNEKEQAITLYLEPWAEEHVIEPNVSLELVGWRTECPFPSRSTIGRSTASISSWPACL